MELSQEYIDATIAGHEAEFEATASARRRARLIRAVKTTARTIGVGAAYVGGTSYGLGYVMQGMVQRG